MARSLITFFQLWRRLSHGFLLPWLILPRVKSINFWNYLNISSVLICFDHFCAHRTGTPCLYTTECPTVTALTPRFHKLVCNFLAQFIGTMRIWPHHWSSTKNDEIPKYGVLWGLHGFTNFNHTTFRRNKAEESRKSFTSSTDFTHHLDDLVRRIRITTLNNGKALWP